jgi:hypothetical protein
VSQVDEFDLTELYTKLVDFCQVENVQGLSEKHEKFFLSRPKQGETIIQFHDRISNLNKEVDRVGKTGGHSFIHESLVTWKILQNIPSYPEFLVQNDVVQESHGGPPGPPEGVSEHPVTSERRFRVCPGPNHTDRSSVST